MQRCTESGIDGLIIPDTPYEEKEEFAEACRQYGIDLLSMIAPSSADRVRAIGKNAEGFLYCVSSLGVTGVRDQLSGEIASAINIVREETAIPCAIGFGISTPEQANDGGVSRRHHQQRDREVIAGGGNGRWRLTSHS